MAKGLPVSAVDSPAHRVKGYTVEQVDFLPAVTTETRLWHTTEHMSCATFYYREERLRLSA